MLGPMGSGALVAKPELLEAMPPYHGGGEMISRVWDDHATYNKIPHKFEAGTPNVEGAVGLAAAIGYLERIGRERIAADRKSTRLNSSHQIISYAVFCLKKKTHKIHADAHPQQSCHVTPHGPIV